MASPLFRTFNEAVKREAREAFHGTSVGELYRDAQEFTRGFRRGYNSPLAFFTRRLGQIQRHGVLDALIGASGERSKLRGIVQQYARGKSGELTSEAISAILERSGPIGQVIAAILGRKPAAGRRATVNRELETMTKALQAFGFETLHKPTKDNPPTRREIEAAKAVLESAGYTVIPPAKKGGQPVVLVKDRSRSRPGQQTIQVGETSIKATGSSRVKLTMGGETLSVDKSDPIVTGQMIPVDSSTVHSIGYDISESPGNLLVRFLSPNGGAGPLYVYFGVSMHKFQSFRNAASKGRWVWDNLRIRGTVSGHQYDYRLEEGYFTGNRLYIPRKATLTAAGEEYIPRADMLSTPGTRSLPRELIRALTPAQYRKAVRGGVDRIDRGRQNGRDRTRGSRRR